MRKPEDLAHPFAEIMNSHDARRFIELVAVIGAVLSRQLIDLEPQLTRDGYDVRNLVEQFDAKPAEIRRLLRGDLAPGRSQELLDQNARDRATDLIRLKSPCAGPHGLASVSPIVRPFSNSLRRSPAPIPINVRQKPRVIVGWGVHHRAPPHIVRVGRFIIARRHT